MAGAHSFGLSGLAGRRGSAVHGLDPRAKVIALMGVTLVAVSAPLPAWPTFLGCAGVLAAIAYGARVPVGVLWRRARIVLVPVLLVACSVPFVRSGGLSWDLGPLVLHEAGLAVALLVALKASIGTLGAVLLGATTRLPDVLHALERLRTPRLFVLIAALMHRYVFVLLAEVRSMRAALVARCWRPRSALHAGAAGRVAGTLFLRAHARGERVHRAMLARGWNGHMPQGQPTAFGRTDAAFVALVLLTVVSVRVAAGLSA